MTEFVDVDHPRFRKIEKRVFVDTLVADCMTHSCKLVTLGDTVRLDACCQYGADVDVGERDAILAKKSEIEQFVNVPSDQWFSGEPTQDADFPSGAFVRTAAGEKGCVFLDLQNRGCNIHRASLAGGWDFNGIKPNICRLFPITFSGDELLISDDYQDYSCAFDSAAPSIYQVGRSTLSNIFGPELTEALDAAEKLVLASQ